MSESLLAGAPGARAAFDTASSRWWTYGELEDAVHARAADLARAEGAPAASGTPLHLCYCRNDMASLVEYLACIEHGRAVALLDADMPEAARRDLESAYAGATPSPSLALMLPTSGSTGSSKFVRLSRRNVLANADSIRAALAIDVGERAMLSLPMHYSYGLSVVNSHLRAGAALVVTGASVTSREFWDQAAIAEATSAAGVPYTYQMLRRLGVERVAPASLRTLTQAGGRLAPELALEFHGLMAKRGGRFFVMYGQTEATARIAILPSERLPEKPGSAGRAIPGGTLRVEDGEIVYEGPNVMLGYAERAADLARGDELHGVLRTGDMGSLDEEGFLFITGRAKRFAKVFGLRLNLDDVERLVRGAGPAAAVEARTGERLVIFLEAAHAPADLAAVRQDLAAALRLHHSAIDVRALERLPLMANGKVDYEALKGRS